MTMAERLESVSARTPTAAKFGRRGETRSGPQNAVPLGGRRVASNTSVAAFSTDTPPGCIAKVHVPGPAASSARRSTFRCIEEFGAW
jgi:hypothetical protein